MGVQMYKKKPERYDYLMVECVDENNRVVLLEYGRREGRFEGTINLGDIRAARVRKAAREVVVEEVEKEKEIYKAEDRYYKSKVVHAILEEVAGGDESYLLRLYNKLIWPLCGKKLHAIEVVKAIPLAISFANHKKAKEAAQAANDKKIDVENEEEDEKEVDEEDDEEEADEKEDQKVGDVEEFNEDMMEETYINLGLKVDVVADYLARFEDDQVMVLYRKITDVIDDYWQRSYVPRLLESDEDEEINNEQGMLPKEVTWKNRFGGIPVRTQKLDDCEGFSLCTLLTYCLKIKKEIDDTSLVRLSVQQINDKICLAFPLNVTKEGEDGFHVAHAICQLQYVQNFGIAFEEDYEYEGKRLMGSAVPKRIEGDKVVISGYENLRGKSHEKVKRILCKGPILASMDIGCDFQKFDGKGVFMGEKPDSLKKKKKGDKPGAHAVVVVGFGVENEKEFYVIHNSHGDTWADQGFAKVFFQLVRPTFAVHGTRIIKFKEQSEEMKIGTSVKEIKEQIEERKVGTTIEERKCTEREKEGSGTEKGLIVLPLI